MKHFVTGATGYLGSYAAADLLRRGESLILLVRAQNQDAAVEKLWGALQLHFGAEEFRDHWQSRVEVVLGDIAEPRFGLAADEFSRIARSTTSVLHCAASLNRRSERACAITNVVGTVEVIRLARAAAESSGLRRFTMMSTVAVAGERAHEVVEEDDALDWSRRDYDPYSRTKRLAEKMVHALLEDVSRVIVRPSIVLGDSARPETTQFDMVRAFDFLARLPLLPLRADDRIDIVPANWVGQATVKLHLSEKPRFDTYHLSSGEASPTYQAITTALAAQRNARPPRFVPALEKVFARTTTLLSKHGPASVRRGAALLDVFLPYLVWNTVFDNRRALAEAGPPPAAFPAYCGPLLSFARTHHFKYPVVPLPPAFASGAGTPGLPSPRPSPAPRSVGSLP